MQTSGEGTTVTEDFSLQGGLVVFDMLHENGESNFIVELKDAESGETTESLANEIGEWMGVYPMFAPDGEYFLEIDADGDWEFVITQPRPAPSEAEPTPVSGSDEFPNYLGLIRFEGVTNVRGEYSGEGNFAVWLLNGDGQRVDLLFNEIGEFEGETTISEEGTGYLRVEATGSWTVEARQR